MLLHSCKGTSKMDESTLSQQLERNAAAYPDKIAIISHERKYSYKHLNELVNRLASAMQRIGVKPGDRVGLMMTRTPELVIGFLAAAKVGGIAVPINFELSAEGIRSIFVRTQPCMIIAAGQFAELVRAALQDSENTRVLLIEGAGTGWLGWDEFIATGSPENPTFTCRVDDAVYLNYTSGSTGNSKGAVTTHRHIYWNTAASVDALNMTEHDVHLCMFAPFAHPHELFARPLYLGGTMVLLENVYPKSLAKAIEDNRVTCMMGLAPMYENLLEVLDHKTYDLRSLRIPESGGMFTRLDLAERFSRKLGVPIIPVWGSTETTGIALANRPGKTPIPGSVGKPCLSYDVKVVDDDGKELPFGEIGEMIFRGPGVVEKYYEDIGSSDACFREGWYYSGDLGRCDEHGNFYFTERKKGMMKVAGLKVYPLEIEQVLLDHPQIKEAAVIAAKDRLRGEIPKAIIVARDGETITEKDVLLFCRERLAHYKVPRIIELRESLPKIGSGKINKKVLQLEEA